MVAKNPLKICLVSAELSPLAKTGGLADVTAALSAQLRDDGHDVRVLVPFYSSIDTHDLEVTPVAFLQDIPIQMGGRHGYYSIDTVTLRGSGLQVYLLRCPDLYDREGIYTAGADEHLRFILLARGAIEMCQHMGFAPDIFHCHDWHAALAPLYLKTRYAWDRLFAATRSVLTIHNIGYQGIFNASVLADLGIEGAEHKLHQQDLELGRINFLKTGIVHADLLTTVSPTYAEEIQGEEYGMGLDKLLRTRSDSLVGILNGVDYDEWNPENDVLIPHTYTSKRLAGKKKCKLALMKDLEFTGGADRPMIGMVTRLTAQKGIDLVQKVMPAMLARRDFTLAVLGSGEPRYERYFMWLQDQFRDRVCFYRGYNNTLAHWIEAGSDMFLMPSRYEPCGLNQMYSLRYGAVPIVRQTGGLTDSVEPIDPAHKTGTGILFQHYNDAGLRWALDTALDLYENQPVWRKIARNGMSRDFSWARQVRHYVRLFEALRDSA